MHFSFKPANLSKYYDQNNNPGPESIVGPISKQRQRFKKYKHPETIQSVPEVKFRPPQVEDVHYRLPLHYNPTSSSGSSTLFSMNPPYEHYEPSPAVVQLIQGCVGLGIQPNPHPRNSWELLKPFEHIVNLRYCRRTSLPEPRINRRGDSHLSHLPQIVPQSTEKHAHEWPPYSPFRGMENYGQFLASRPPYAPFRGMENYGQFDAKNEVEDTMSIDPILLQDHAYEVSSLNEPEFSSTSGSQSLSSNHFFTAIKDPIGSDPPATTILSAYIDPNRSISSPIRVTPTTMSSFSPCGSSSRAGVPSSPLVPPSPCSTVSVVWSSIAGSESANQQACFSSSHLSSIANSSPPRPVSRRLRTSQKRHASLSVSQNSPSRSQRRRVSISD